MNKNKLNIALYGGSFDPPHKGHEKVVEQALKKLPIDKLFITPAWLNPFKKSFFAPPELRLRWLESLWTYHDKINICTYELENARPTPTLETIMYLHDIYTIDKFYLIIGADNVQNLSKWYKYEELKQKVEFVVATRKGYKIDVSFLGLNVLKLEVDIDISSSSLRQCFQKEFINKNICKELKEFYMNLSLKKQIQDQNAAAFRLER